MEALRVGISFSPGIGNKAILPRNIMRIPAMSKILRSSNLDGKIKVFNTNIVTSANNVTFQNKPFA